MPFVNDRWLGGTLTNFRTIRSRLSRLEELEKLMASEDFATYSKKMQSALKREFRKMYRNLNGIRTMNRAPDCMVIIDPKKEKNSVSEARKIGVSTVSLIDTDCDPDLIDLPIPGNDDSIRSIELIVQQLADAVLDGKAEAATMGHGKAEASGAPAKDKDAAPQANGAPIEVAQAATA
jgi:small subunit ribosomal protein S2